MNEQITIKNIEINSLKAWFDWYDTQVMQYNRDIRINGSSNINLSTLDAQAVINAARIKTLQSEIAELWEEEYEATN